jgi:ATP-dependent protease HslVU (ClpYQ) peptidase subunit
MEVTIRKQIRETRDKQELVEQRERELDLKQKKLMKEIEEERKEVRKEKEILESLMIEFEEMQ